MPFSPEFMSNGMTILALIVAAALLLLKRRMERPTLPPEIKSFAEMPTPQGANFLLGHILCFDPSKIHLKFCQWANELGGIFCIRLLNLQMVKLSIPQYSPHLVFTVSFSQIVISDPKLFLPIVGSGSDALPKNKIYDDFNDLAGPEGHTGIFTMPDADPKYKLIRKELALAFSMKQMKEVMPSLVSSAIQLAIKFGNQESIGSSIDVLHDIEISILDHLLRSSFNMNISGDMMAEFLKHLAPSLSELSIRISNPLRAKLQRLLFFLPSSQRVQADFKGMYRMWNDIHNHIKSNAPYQSTDSSFAACLWRIEGTHGLLPIDVVANISVMVIAGFETSSA